MYSIGKKVEHDLNCSIYVQILDLHTGLEVGPYMKGELYVRAPTLMMRYWKDPEKTSKAIDAQGWLRTGNRLGTGTDYVYCSRKPKGSSCSLFK